MVSAFSGIGIREPERLDCFLEETPERPTAGREGFPQPRWV